MSFRDVFFRRNKAESNPLWLTVFCDMTTNLMLFFLLLYAFTRLSEEKQQTMFRSLHASGSRTEEIKQKASRVINEFREEETADAMSQLSTAAGEDVSVEVSEKQIRLTLTSPLLFDSGAAELKSSRGMEQLSAILSKLDSKIIVEGHTDDIPVKSGNYSSNWELSIARSVSVINTLVTQFGLPAERFVSAGYGEFRPVAPNDTPQNRAKNRRIEITVIRKT